MEGSLPLLILAGTSVVGLTGFFWYRQHRQQRLLNSIARLIGARFQIDHRTCSPRDGSLTGSFRGRALIVRLETLDNDWAIGLSLTCDAPTFFDLRYHDDLANFEVQLRDPELRDLVRRLGQRFRVAVILHAKPLEGSTRLRLAIFTGWVHLSVPIPTNLLELVETAVDLAERLEMRPPAAG